MDEKENKEIQENKENKKFLILIIIFIILIILIAFLINHLGKIGYVNTSNEQTYLIEVTQNDIGWDMLEELNIFRNQKYNNQNIIAPKSTGTYTFLVKNITDTNLVYDLQLKEINKYNINMKYKLKLENVYIAGSKEEWKDIKDINIENIIVPAESTNLYTLEWYWADNDVQDTKIGSLTYADYTLRIKIGAQIYDKNIGDNN